MSAIQELPKVEIIDKYERLKNSLRNAAKKAEKPMIQGLHGVSAVGGGALGGLVAGVRPHLFKLPTDAILGAVVALPCLAVAGSTAGDVGAMIGWGMLAGAASKATTHATTSWREKRAADGGDATAAQIVNYQNLLETLRKQRETPPANVTKAA